MQVLHTVTTKDQSESQNNEQNTEYSEYLFNRESCPAQEKKRISITSHFTCFENEIKLECLASQSKPEPKIKKYSQIELQSEVTINFLRVRVTK